MINKLKLLLNSIFRKILTHINQEKFILRTKKYIMSGELINSLKSIFLTCILIIFKKIKIFKEQRKEKKWYKFFKSNKNNIIKILPNGYKIRLYKLGIKDLAYYIFVDKYDKKEQFFLNKILKEGDIFLDIGANIGFYSLIASKIVKDRGKVFAFEPCIETFRKLEENIAINKIKNIIPQNIALSNKKGRAILKKSIYDSFNSLGTPIEGYVSNEEILTDTLDNFVKENNLLEKINLIKIDTEGWEVPILENAKKLLNGDDSPILIVEFNKKACNDAGYSCEKLFKLIKSYGYNLYTFNLKKKTLNLWNYDNYYSGSRNYFAIKNIIRTEKRLLT